MPGYETKVYKIFPKLKALDGNRKNVQMTYNMRDALPLEEDVDEVAYSANTTEFFDTVELENAHPELHRYEDSTVLKREESQLNGVINDCKQLLDKKTNILTY